MKYKLQITKIINNIITRTHSLHPNTPLKNIGIDSISFVQLIVEIEKAFNIEFPDDKLTLSQVGTIKALCETIAEIKGRTGLEN